jgi:hypothetical protein
METNTECRGSKSWKPAAETGKNFHRSVECPECGQTVATQPNPTGNGRRLAYHEVTR